MVGWPSPWPAVSRVWGGGLPFLKGPRCLNGGDYRFLPAFFPMCCPPPRVSHRCPPRVAGRRASKKIWGMFAFLLCENGIKEGGSHKVKNHCLPHPICAPPLFHPVSRDTPCVLSFSPPFYVAIEFFIMCSLSLKNTALWNCRVTNKISFYFFLSLPRRTWFICWKLLHHFPPFF